MSNVPNHVAIIPDGNRRWAKERGLPTFEGHKKGFEQVQKLGKKAREMGIRILTIWAFSTENWQRSKEEVKYLMKLYELMIDSNLKEALREKIRIVHLGRKDRLSKNLKEKLIQAEEKTQKFDKYYLVIALDYGGRDEVLRALNKIQTSQFPTNEPDHRSVHGPIPNESSGIRVSKLNQENINQFLDTKDLPYPNVDLVIRTSGEYRTSGFMIWQTTYSEYIFSHKYFPDFSVDDFEECIGEYQKRQRRFGR